MCTTAITLKAVSTIPFTIATKRIKYLGIYLPKETNCYFFKNNNFFDCLICFILIAPIYIHSVTGLITNVNNSHLFIKVCPLGTVTCQSATGYFLLQNIRKTIKMPFLKQSELGNSSSQLIQIKEPLNSLSSMLKDWTIKA